MTTTTQSLNGLWNFRYLGPIDLNSFQPAPVLPGEKMPVPSAFDAMPSHVHKRGAAVYSTTITIPAGQPARLEFGAVSMWCRIFVDGRLLHENACGYAPFVVDIEAAPHEQRELVVLVDNRFDFTRVPMHEDYFDFYQYGGILRPVTLRLLPRNGPFVDSLRLTPTENYRQGEISLAVVLHGDVSATVPLHIQIDGNAPLSFPAVPVEKNSAHLRLNVPSPQIWSPATPQLHTLRVTISADSASETITTKFGLRRIEARDGALWLNDEKLILKGFNRHEWHPNFGPCTPSLQMVADLQLLRDMGCNFIRGSHYPQDQQFLDLCDEYGFLVWEENLGWGQREKTFTSEKFRADHTMSLRAMVRASYNHPSVIIWGFLNEAGTKDDYVRPVFEESVATLRALDPSRLISYATMFGKVDKHYDLADLIGLNIYPGWYHAEAAENPLDLIVPGIRSFYASIDERGFAAKPVILSEIGAEALYGWHDSHNDFFTEEFQANYLKLACSEALSNPRSSGIALWHFSDARTYSGGRSLLRPRAFNNKGILDEYRRPKAAYHAVKECFHSAS